MAGQGGSTEAVFEFLDVVVSAASSEMVLDETAACTLAICEDGIVSELADHTLVAFVMRDFLDDHAGSSGPILRTVGELTPVSVLLPGIGFRLIRVDGLNGPIEGSCELSGDGELHALAEKIGDYPFVVESGVHAHADVAVSGQTGEARGDEACSLVIAVSVSGSEFDADEEPVLGPEAEQWMESPDSLVTVAGALFKEAIDLEDGAVQVQGDDFVTADELCALEESVSDDPFELFYVAYGELTEELTCGGWSRRLQIVEVRSSSLLSAESFQIGQVRSAYEEVVDRAHDEITCGDAAFSLLDAHFGEAGFDPILFRVVDNWLKTVWPFEKVIYPDRELSWEEFYRRLDEQDAKYH